MQSRARKNREGKGYFRKLDCFFPKNYEVSLSKPINLLIFKH